jgi:hypothetical protein
MRVSQNAAVFQLNTGYIGYFYFFYLLESSNSLGLTISQWILPTAKPRPYHKNFLQGIRIWRDMNLS